jgi:DNA-binding NtrC family response regulator
MTTTPILLLVEDEVLVALPVEEILVEAGFEVVLATSSVQAVQQLQTRAKEFKALVTDIRLPGKIDGWGIAHRARELNPSIPVIYMSADSGIEWASKGVPNSQFIQKPFALAQIVTAVATLINSAPITSPPDA